VSGEGSGVNVSIVRSLAEAEEAVSAIRARTQRDPYLQQYVNGPSYLAGGLFSEGVPLRLFAAEVTQQSPDKIGPAVSVRSCGDAELLQSFCALVKAVQWTGFAQADYVRDEHGRFAFLEVNPRPWGSIAAAARVGVDFFTPLVQLFRGEMPDARLDFPSGRDIALFPQRVRAHLRSSRAFVSRWLAAASDLASWHAVLHTDPRLIGPYLRWMIYRRRDLVRRLELDAR
jgi:predicted ATP-grasp superfamily ATP-dependent carboligase